jgi:hypothetical protein
MVQYIENLSSSRPCFCNAVLFFPDRPMVPFHTPALALLF